MTAASPAAAVPYTIRKSRRKFGNQSLPVEILTFTGSTSDEYDVFLDARFDRGEPLGWLDGARAKMGRLAEGQFVKFQFARRIDGE